MIFSLYIFSLFSFFFSPFLYLSLRMLFHNRPVKADMGSVIVNGGVQLSGGKSLVDTKLATLHFGAE